LTDWKEQDERFLKEDKERKRFGKINHPIDKGFIEALKYGLKPCSGIAIGIERLAMIFAQVDSIDQLKLINIS
jgi:elongation factor P--beta-lysine ligase